MPYSVRLLRLLERVDPALREVLLAILEEIERQREESVTKREFNELKEIVREIGEEVRRLAEAQKKTEEELRRLSEAQKKTEEIVRDLSEAQKRTEEEVRSLSEAQRKTEEEVRKLSEEVRSLSEAQRKTEEEVRKLSEGLKTLTEEHRKTREQLGNLQHSVGYLLEDRAYKGLPSLLERDFGLRLISPLRRKYLEVSPGKYLEVNILGEAARNGEKVFIVGECKSQLKKRDVDAFLRILSRLQKILQEKILPVLVTYQTSPQVEQYVKEKGLKLYFSFEFPL